METVLLTHQLTKNFGRLCAVNRLDLGAEVEAVAAFLGVHRRRRHWRVARHGLTRCEAELETRRCRFRAVRGGTERRTAKAHGQDKNAPHIPG